MRACSPDHDVLERRHRLEQADVLERARHAGPVTRSGASAVMSLAVERDLAAGRLVEPGQHVEERRLAGAVGADDRDDRLRRTVKSTSLTAIRPPKILVTLAAEDAAVERRSAAAGPPFALMPRTWIERSSPSRRSSVQLHLAPPLGIRPSGAAPSYHAAGSRRSRTRSRDVEVQADFAGRCRAVRDAVAVDARQHDRAERPRPRCSRGRRG